MELEGHWPILREQLIGLAVRYGGPAGLRPGDDGCGNRGVEPIELWGRPLIRRRDADIQGQGTGAGGRFEPLAVLGGLAVVSQSKVQTTIFHSSTVVLPEDKSQLRRCDCMSSARALDRNNKLYVR